jgi:hypothetical protein
MGRLLIGSGNYPRALRVKQGHRALQGREKRPLRASLPTKCIFRETSGRFMGFIGMTHESQDPVLVPGSNPDPASSDHAPVKSTTDARAGVTFGTMRWVLAISIAAVVIVFGLVWLGTHT